MTVRWTGRVSAGWCKRRPRGDGRQARLSSLDDGEGVSAGAVVRPLRPSDGRGLEGPHLLLAIRGVGPARPHPGHFTISRFRTALGEKLTEELFLELERQLRERGVVLKKATLMDATLVEARVRSPSLKEGRGTKSPTDPDAEWILLSPWEAGPFGLQGAYWGRSRVGPSEARRRSLPPRYTRARWPTIW